MIRNSTRIQILVQTNPHREGSMDWIRFNLIRTMETELGANQVMVGHFVRRHNELGTVGTTSNARRYLRYMVDRGQFTLPGFNPRPRLPRLPASAFVALPIAADLSEFTFGCELECYLPRGVSAEDVARQLTDEGIDTRVEHLSHGTRTWWKIVTDGSLRDYDRGREIVAPILKGQDGLRQVEHVCRKLLALGCTVNKRCGYHVHVGHAGNANSAAYFQRLLQFYAWNEATLDTIVAPSRRGPMAGEGFCGSVRAPRQAYATVEDVCRSVGATGNRSSARYRKLNVDCWWSQRTVEFRQHQGTVDADKACNWIQLCLHIAKFAASGAELPSGVNLETLLTTLGLSDELRTYFLARAAYFVARERRAA